MAIVTACATNNNIGDLSNVTSPIDGHVLQDGDLVLVKDQSDSTQNGVYLCSASGMTFEFSRADVMDTWKEVVGALVTVIDGNNNAASVWLSTAQPDGMLDSTVIGFARLPNILTPEQFGAKGNGSDNDIVALDAMCRAIEAAGGGVALFTRKYLIDEDRTVTPPVLQLYLPFVPFSFKGTALASDTKGPGSIFSTNLACKKNTSTGCIFPKPSQALQYPTVIDNISAPEHHSRLRF